MAQYRNGKGRGKNNSTLDDGISQSAIRLLMHVDRAHEFNHQSIHDSARVALDALLKAQFPNGAFPQVWTKPVTAQPVKKPKYPDYDWRTEGRIKEYWNLYTLNDGVAGYVAGVLIDAHRIYGHRRYLEALRRLGDFLVLAQMPDPQPAWAQQYNYEMVPVWARRFEPAAIACREPQDVMETLMRIYRHTGDARFLKPIPRALNYLRSSQLKDGRLARYYELRSNRPLYMTRRGKNYLLTYDDSRLPGHYGWKVTSRLDQIERDYRQVQRGDRSKNPRLQTPDTQQVARAIAELDEQGRWISTFQGEPLVGQPKFARGTKYISSAVFSQRLELLSRFVSDR